MTQCMQVLPVGSRPNMHDIVRVQRCACVCLYACVYLFTSFPSGVSSTVCFGPLLCVATCVCMGVCGGCMCVYLLAGAQFERPFLWLCGLIRWWSHLACLFMCVRACVCVYVCSPSTVCLLFGAPWGVCTLCGRTTNPPLVCASH